MIDEKEAKEIYKKGETVVVEYLMKISRKAEAAEIKVAELEAQIKEIEKQKTPPPFVKENTRKKRLKKRGRKNGHDGSGRKSPEKIDNTKVWDIKHCPDCNTKLSRITETYTRNVEDIKFSNSIVTKEIVRRRYCKKCKKIITAPMPDALPNCRIGIKTLITTAWFHYFIGVSLNKIVSIFAITHFLKITNGYLIDSWYKLADILKIYYYQIQQELQTSVYIHIDETGWRIFGKNAWLWSFSTNKIAYFTINQTRGSTVLFSVLGECFKGIIISDFWAAYNKISALAKQKCLIHLLREVKRISKYSDNSEWISFAKKLKRLFHDAIRLSLSKESLNQICFESRKKRFYLRLKKLYLKSYSDKNANRIAKRWLQKYEKELLVFIDYDIPKDNNTAEQDIRNGVIMRKISFGNQSANGAEILSVFLTIFTSLKKNNINPVKFLINSVRKYIKTGSLLPLPFLTSEK